MTLNAIQEGWQIVLVRDVLKRVKGLPKSVPSSKILLFGLVPVVDQGKSLTAGYTSNADFEIDCPPEGLLVFGDHTRVVKFIDFNFATGADGTQVLEPRIPLSMRFITYAIQNQEIPNTGYNRHYKYLAELEVLIPGLEEQNAIAETLSDMDSLIESLDKLIAKKRAIRQGAMQQLWSKSRSWAEVEVKRVLIDYFCGPSPTCEERNIKGDEWGVLRTTCTTWENGWNWKSHKLLPSSYWGQAARMVRIGDTIITKAGPRHRVGVPSFVDFIPNNIVPSGKMIALRPNPAVIDPYFLSSALREKSSQHFLNERTTGMAESQVNFENKVLLNTPIKVPSLAEQKEITSVSRDLDAEIDILVARREKTALIKIGMMQDLLTGKVRL